MSRYTSEDAVNAIGNRYDLVIVASARARDLAKGHHSMLNSKSGPVVKALEEIEAKQVDRNYVAKTYRGK